MGLNGLGLFARRETKEYEECETEEQEEGEQKRKTERKKCKNFSV